MQRFVLVVGFAIGLTASTALADTTGPRCIRDAKAVAVADTSTTKIAAKPPPPKARPKVKNGWYFFPGARPGEKTPAGMLFEGAGGATEFKRGDVKLGDKLVVDGYLAKDGSHLIDARRVTLPDGRRVDGGSEGDGGPGR